MMRLALLLDRRYAPYQKWLGTAFAAIADPDGLSGNLADALHARDLPDREHALCAGYRALAARHNATGLTAPLDTATRNYHSRPAQVLMADRFADALFATVTDEELHQLGLLGSVDQVVDSTDVLESTAHLRALRALYRNGGAT